MLNAVKFPLHPHGQVHPALHAAWSPCSSHERPRIPTGSGVAKRVITRSGTPQHNAHTPRYRSASCGWLLQAVSYCLFNATLLYCFRGVYASVHHGYVIVGNRTAYSIIAGALSSLRMLHQYFCSLICLARGSPSPSGQCLTNWLTIPTTSQKTFHDPLGTPPRLAKLLPLPSAQDQIACSHKKTRVEYTVYLADMTTGNLHTNMNTTTYSYSV